MQKTDRLMYRYITVGECLFLLREDKEKILWYGVEIVILDEVRDSVFQ